MFSVEYLYRIVDKYSPILNKMAAAGKKFDKTVSKIQGSLGRMEDKFKSAGAKMANLQTGLASLGAGVFLKGALDEAVEFGDGIGRIGTLIPGQEARLNSLKETITELGISTGTDLNNIAGGAFGVISAFGDMEEETEARLKAVTNAAVAGGTSASEALSLLSAVTKSYGDTSGEALQKASDLAFMTNVLGETTFPEMAASIGQVLPLAAQLGVTQEEVFAATAAMSGVTGNTSAVMTQQASIMSAFIKPSSEMTKAIEKAGFASASAMIKSVGLSGALDILKKSAGGSEEKVGKLFGRKEAMVAFFSLSGAQSGKFSESLIAMGEAAVSNGKVTQDALNEMMKTPGFKLRQMTVSFQALKIAMGDIIATTITPLVKKFIPFVNSLREAHPEMLKNITKFLMFITVLGAVLIPLGLLISSIGSLFGAIKLALGITKIFGIAQALLSGAFGLSGVSIANTTIATNAYMLGSKIAMAATKLWAIAQAAFNAVMIANPIGLIIVAIAALIGIIILVVKHWDDITAAVKRVWNWFSKLLDNPLIATAALIFAPFFAIPALIIKHWKPIIAFFIGIWETIKPVIEGVKGFVGGVGEFFTGGKESGANPYRTQMAEAPVPGGYGGANATANATVSVYTEKGLTAKPFKPSGDLGYNMSDTYSRGM